MTRVGLLLPRYLSHPTGIVTYSKHLATNLGVLPGPVSVILLNRSREAQPDWFKAFEVIDLASSARHLSLVTRLQAVARSARLDLVHATGNLAPFLGPSLGVRRVATVHDLGPIVRPRERSSRDRLAHATLIPLLRWTADAVIADSSATARDLRDVAHINERNIAVVPLGAPPVSTTETYDSDALRQPLGISRPYFLAVGDVAEHKNLRGVLQAFERVIQRGSDVRLVVVGQSAFGGPSLNALGRTLGDSVVFTGFVDDDLRDHLYAGATALVFASFHEGFGLPALEAMAHGTPVIASNCSSLPEVTGDAALLVDPHSVESIEQAMLRVLGEPDLRAALRHRGRDRVRRFTWKRTAELTRAVYESVLEVRTSSSPDQPTGRRVA